MNSTRNSQTNQLLLGVGEVCSMLSIGRTHFYQQQSSGRFGPMPVKLGRRSLYRKAELEAWTEAGCPNREKWQKIKADKGL